MAEKFDWRMNRYERMKSTWVDLCKKGHCRLPFAVFEKRMLERDLAAKKKAFYERSFVWNNKEPLEWGKDTLCQKDKKISLH